MPTQKYLEIYHRYDPVTGIFTDLSGYQGSINSDGYKKFNIYGIRYYVHRLIWKLVRNEEPDTINHLDGNPSNNIWTNLENGDEQNNLRNRLMSSNNTSGYPGVNFDKHKKKWLARIYVNNIQTFLGYYDCPTNAWIARVQYFKQHPELNYTKRHLYGA